VGTAAIVAGRRDRAKPRDLGQEGRPPPAAKPPVALAASLARWGLDS